MKLEEQVCSLELAKKLKELGVEQASIFYWDKNGSLLFDEESGFIEVNSGGEVIDYEVFKNITSAFTVAELGELLPINYTTGKNIGRNTKKKIIDWIGGYYVAYSDDGYSSAETEANARAKCLYYLLKNDIVKVEDINK